MFYDNKYVPTPFPSLQAAPSQTVQCGPAARQVRLRRAAVPAGARLPVRGRRLALAVALAPALLVACASARAQGAAQPGTGMSLERKVKAAFLYKFLGYAEFPASALGEAGAPVVIGVIDADELAAELTRIVSGRTVGARPIAVKVFREHDAPSGVHLLFVGGGDAQKVRTALRAVASAPVLLVTESDDGLRQGSVINFRIIDERVRFDVSLGAAEKNSVKLSSRLLTVANHVHKGAP